MKKWRNENPDLSIEECIKTVFKLKPITIITHIIVVEVQDSLRKFINSNNDYVEKILDKLRESIPGKFYDVNAGKSVMSISMDEDAYKIFDENQSKKKISYTKFFNHILGNRIE